MLKDLVNLLDKADDGQEDCEPAIIRMTAGEARRFVDGLRHLMTIEGKARALVNAGVDSSLHHDLFNDLRSVVDA